MNIVDTPDKVLRQRDAIGRAIGYPVRMRLLLNGCIDVTGHPVWDQMPKTYAGRGTPGWCDYDPEIVVSDDGTVAAFAIAPEHEQHLGKTVRLLDGTSAAIVARADLVPDAQLPARIKAARDQFSAQRPG